MEWKLFADLAEVAGDRHIVVEIEAGATVGDALDALLADHPDLEYRVRADDGGLRPQINVLRNGRDVQSEENGLATQVTTDDELALFPPVSGG